MDYRDVTEPDQSLILNHVSISEYLTLLELG
jgi:hypothetical protein